MVTTGKTHRNIKILHELLSKKGESSTLAYYDQVNSILREYYQPHDCLDQDEVKLTQAIVCADIINQQSARDRQILREIFSHYSKPVFRADVKICADSFGLPEWVVWKMIRNVTKKIARELNLTERG